MISKIKARLTNLPLGKKMIVLLLPGIFLMSLLTLIGFFLIISSSNRILYQTSSELLSYSSRDISQNLTAISDMADFILENPAIQKQLSLTKDAKGSSIPADAYSEVYSTIGNYYEKFKGNYIDYIQLTNDKFVTTKSSIDSHVMPEDLRQELLLKAQEQDGRLFWITDYSDEYGLFLVRSIRRIDHLKLDELGVLIINVNINQMLEDLTANSGNSAGPLYLICSDRQIICHSPALDGVTYEELVGNGSDSYSVVKLEGKRYFMVSGHLASTGWNYFCLSPYDGLYNNILFFQRLFVCLILVSFLLCLLLTKALIQPLILHFNNLMQKIRVFGNDSFEIMELPYSYENRKDEIGLLHQQFDAMALKIQTLIKENYENEILIKEAQLKALEMQINPHFLYNTLESINWRAKALGDKQISSMVESLGKLLRITLSKKFDSSSFRQELELVQCYMNIQQIRFEGELFFTCEVPEELLELYIPRFTIQPLVENAVHYSLENEGDDCHITIKARRSGDEVLITIANTGSVFEEDLIPKLTAGKIHPHGFGIGILNVDKRLKLAFGQQYGLSFYNEEDQAVAQIELPAVSKDKEMDDSCCDC